MDRDHEDYLRAKFGLGPAPPPYQPLPLDLVDKAMREVHRRSLRIALVSGAAAAVAGAVALATSANGLTVALATYLTGRLVGWLLIRRLRRGTRAPTLHVDTR